MRIPIFAMTAMLVAAILGTVLKPSKKIADEQIAFSLEHTVPKEFGDWFVDPSAAAAIVANPQQQALIDALYAQTLSRTYVNRRGDRIMLSVAYGSSQSDSMQVHRPEVCYPAQGFVLQSSRKSLLQSLDYSIPITQLIATQGVRREPITYWFRIGDSAVDSGFRHKLAQLKYSLVGRIPDGMLIRISSIGFDAEHEFFLQRNFVQSLLGVLPEQDRRRFIGIQRQQASN